MANSSDGPYTRLLASIWTDDEFLDLSVPAQLLYFLLTSVPGRDLCGVSQWHVGKICARAATWVPDAVEAAANELEEKFFIAIDQQTEEVLVRSFARRDTAVKVPNMAVALARAWKSVASRRLRGIIAHEIQRRHSQEPDLKAWEHPEVQAILQHQGIDMRTEKDW